MKKMLVFLFILIGISIHAQPYAVFEMRYDLDPTFNTSRFFPDGDTTTILTGVGYEFKGFNIEIDHILYSTRVHKSILNPYIGVLEGEISYTYGPVSIGYESNVLLVHNTAQFFRDVTKSSIFIRFDSRGIK